MRAKFVLSLRTNQRVEDLHVTLDRSMTILVYHAVRLLL